VSWAPPSEHQLVNTGNRPLKIMVLGVRGMPNVQGGIETHAEHLYAELARLGCDIEVLVRSPYAPPEVRNVGSIRLRRLWSPRRPGFEALLHSLLGVLYAGIVRPDVLHIHAVGPAIVTPIARLLGLRVVVTHHGPDYDRDKWGGVARWVLRSGERAGMCYSHARIAISKVIADLIQAKYQRVSDLIPNGVAAPPEIAASDYVRGRGLEPGRYFLQVSRMVPEKRQLHLIEAFARARPQGWKLALVGGLDDSDYSRQVQARAAEAGVVLTGFVNGAPLGQMYSNAGAFVLPSSHEGLPIALLEALSYGLPVLASDIPANLEIGLPPESYFRTGDIEALAGKLTDMASRPDEPQTRAARRSWVLQKYRWETIASQTLGVYRRLAGQ
jgi:glycosyltransferase involved in cell wall biosynthesis